MSNPLFHEVTDEEWDVLLAARPSLTWDDIAKVYAPPDWCLDAAGALNWLVGCWSLTDRKIKGPSDCAGCDLSAHYRQPEQAGKE